MFTFTVLRAHFICFICCNTMISAAPNVPCYIFMFEERIAEPAVTLSTTGTVTKIATTAIATPVSSSYADIRTTKPTGNYCQSDVNLFCWKVYLRYFTENNSTVYSHENE